MSPNFQPEPPLVLLEAIPSCPITSYLWEEADPQLPTPSFQVVVESHKVSPEPPLLQLDQDLHQTLLLLHGICIYDSMHSAG